MKKGDLVETNRRMDMRDTGGPLIPKGARAIVLRVQRDGLVWVDFGGAYGRRRESQDNFTKRGKEKRQ